MEFEGTSFLGLPTKLFKYNALLREHNGPPVHSVLLQLRPTANASDSTGVYERVRADGRQYLRFEYDVIRLWEESFDAMLAAGPSLAPLAILSDEVEGDVEGAFARLAERLNRPDVPAGLRTNLAEAVYNLGGLRYADALLEDLYRRIQMYDIMQHSSTYQGTLRKGRLSEARDTVLRLGKRRLGEQSAEVRSFLEGIVSLDRLHDLTDRILDVNSWDELLATP